jgi:hypothetical protein
MNTANGAAPCGPQNPRARGTFEDSRYVESIVEHLFLSELLQHRWFVKGERVAVIRPEVDDSGVDLVLEANSRIRHVQLKSRWTRARARSVMINKRLRLQGEPCVVWAFWNLDPASCRMTAQYRYSSPSLWPSPQGAANTFVLKWGDFLPGYMNIQELAGELFD